jgi:hypothetical protein
MPLLPERGRYVCMCGQINNRMLQDFSRTHHYHNFNHTYISLTLYPRVAEASQIFHRDTHVLLKLFSYE